MCDIHVDIPDLFECWFTISVTVNIIQGKGENEPEAAGNQCTYMSVSVCSPEVESVPILGAVSF